MAPISDEEELPKAQRPRGRREELGSREPDKSINDFKHEDYYFGRNETEIRRNMLRTEAAHFVTMHPDGKKPDPC